MSKDFETIGKGIKKLLDEQLDLLDETPQAEQGPIYIRIQELYGVAAALIDEAIQSKSEEYKDALLEVGEAVDAVQKARKKLQATVDALKAVDSFIAAAMKIVKAAT